MLRLCIWVDSSTSNLESGQRKSSPCSWIICIFYGRFVRCAVSLIDRPYDGHGQSSLCARGCFGKSLPQCNTGKLEVSNWHCLCSSLCWHRKPVRRQHTYSGTFRQSIRHKNCCVNRIGLFNKRSQRYSPVDRSLRVCSPRDSADSCDSYHYLVHVFGVSGLSCSYALCFAAACN